MKAVVCREHGLPDRLDLVDDWPSPEMGDNDVRIRVKAAGLNFPDVLIIQGKYQFQPSYRLFQAVSVLAWSKKLAPRSPAGRWVTR